MALAKATPIRALISAAAAFVKVTTISSCTDKGFSISFNRVIIRSTRTAVLPEPAAAATSKVWAPKLLSFGDMMADSCSGVHLTPIVVTSCHRAIGIRTFTKIIVSLSLSR